MAARAGLRVAVGQAEFTIGDVESNLATISALAGDAAAADAELIVLPELAPTGYTTGTVIRERAEPLGGPTMADLAEVARAHELWLITSVPELYGEQVFNTGVVLDPEGALQGSHRKTHLFGSERELFSAGDRATTTVSIGPFVVAVLICYEAEFPEMVRAAALAGAGLVAVPTATAAFGPGSRFARQVIGARATENNVFVAYANHCGPAAEGDYMGGSVIAGPRTEIAGEVGTDRAVCTATLDPTDRDTAAAKLPYLADRRPELY